MLKVLYSLLGLHQSHLYCHCSTFIPFIHLFLCSNSWEGVTPSDHKNLIYGMSFTNCMVGQAKLPCLYLSGTMKTKHRVLVIYFEQCSRYDDVRSVFWYGMLHLPTNCLCFVIYPCIFFCLHCIINLIFVGCSYCLSQGLTNARC
jgi:hypothetical protein